MSYCTDCTCYLLAAYMEFVFHIADFPILIASYPLPVAAACFCALAMTVLASCAIAAHGYARQMATSVSFFNTASPPSDEA